VTAQHRAAVGGRGTGLLLAATVLTGAANYGLSLVLVHLLPAGEFSRFAAVSTLLLTVGTIASAAVPWAMAREAALSRRGDDRRRRAVRFGLASSLAIGIVSAVAVTVASHSYAGPALLAGEGAAAVLILLCAVGVGVLQGERAFATLAGVRILEVVVRLILGVGAALVGWGSAGVIGEFAAGAGAATLWSLTALGRDLYRRAETAGGEAARRERRSLAGHAAGLAAGQTALSLVLTLDVIIGAAAQGGGDGLAGYQALLVFARVPLFLASALATAVFPRLVGAHDERSANRAFRDTLRTFLLLAVVITAGAAAVPPALVGLVLPPQYLSSLGLLPPLALAGFGAALATLLTAYLQARGKLRAAATLMTTAVLAGACAYPMLAHDPKHLAWASATVTLAAATGLFTLVHRHGRSIHVPAATAGPTVLGIVTWLLLDRLSGHTVAWLVATVVVALVVLRAVTPRGRPAGPLRVLHLGFEDPARPGAGGGSVRTHEVNRRLATAGVEVVVACSRYPGFTPRIQDGVRYIPYGWRLGPLTAGHFPAMLAYFAAILTGLWRLEHRWRPDLIVEDFAAPFSSVAVPNLTRTPVVGVVQWLFAADKTRQYHLPFHLVERAGLSAHDELVAVSDDLAGRLRRRNPHATVHVLPNGLEPAAWRADPATPRGRHVLYLGRLEIAQKGMDLLLDAFAAAAPYTTADLHVAGDGPDAAALIDRARRLGIDERVHWLGRVDGAARFELLSRAQLVCMPSRYETFGMVAAEALAVATPVLAFDIPCLRALVHADVGVSVPAYDVSALADALISLANDPARCRRLGAAAPATVRDLDWDAIAAAQLDVYHRAALLPTGGRRVSAVTVAV
jgi:glycosyltransferase involved in cell wall biosynthesis/O-antigen/teichoic acid export membrane protein